jgi:hypothetical protein
VLNQRKRPRVPLRFPCSTHRPTQAKLPVHALGSVPPTALKSRSGTTDAVGPLLRIVADVAPPACPTTSAPSPPYVAPPPLLVPFVVRGVDVMVNCSSAANWCKRTLGGRGSPQGKIWPATGRSLPEREKPLSVQKSAPACCRARERTRRHVGSC